MCETACILKRKLVDIEGPYPREVKHMLAAVKILTG